MGRKFEYNFREYPSLSWFSKPFDKSDSSIIEYHIYCAVVKKLFKITTIIDQERSLTNRKLEATPTMKNQKRFEYH